jgi:hypothetical protein
MNEGDGFQTDRMEHAERQSAVQWLHVRQLPVTAC